ncbi:MAG: PEGA domain-containing protein [Candidatus Korobacteraceae bacterium]|jgi:hypothetical protein
MANYILKASAGAIGLVLSLSCPAGAQAAVEYGHIATGSSASSAGLSNLSNKLGSVLSPNKEPGSVQTIDNRPGVTTRKETDLQDANRRALEQRAGKDAAKISLKSAPAKAMVRIDGKPVGQTPLLISLAPGDYKIEMEGPRMEFGKQQLTVSPNETREIDLPLSAAPRYPSHIELQ